MSECRKDLSGLRSRAADHALERDKAAVGISVMAVFDIPGLEGGCAESAGSQVKACSA